jgi:hypothetical protein
MAAVWLFRKIGYPVTSDFLILQMNLNLKPQKMTPSLDQEHFNLNDAGFCIAVVLSDESIIYIYCQGREHGHIFFIVGMTRT